jgi:hypothetical protein
MVMRATRDFGETPKVMRPPAAHVRRHILATPLGKAPTKHMQNCDACADRDLCLRAVIRLGMFARLECEMASGDTLRTAPRKPRRNNLSQDVLRALQDAHEPLTTIQIAKRIGSRNKIIWRSLQRLVADGHVICTYRNTGNNGGREAVWQLNEV